MSNSNNFDPEIFLKGKLEEQLNVSIRHNTKGNDPPDLEFESNGKQIGIEVTRVMKKMDDGKLSRLWLKNNLPKIIEPCLEAFEKEYACEIRKRGETRCFRCRVTWGDFMKKGAQKKSFNIIKDSIQQTVTQGLKVLFQLPEVKNEEFFSDKTNLWQLNKFWAGNLPGVPIDGGFFQANLDYSIKIDEGFYLDILGGPYKETIPVPKDKLFDDPCLWGVDEGAVIVGEEFAPFKDYIQAAIQEKKERCMSLNKSGPRKGQRKDDKYDEMWLYLYDEINPSLFQLKREQVKAMPFNFEKYWSKVCLFTSLCIPKWYISLSEEL